MWTAPSAGTIEGAVDDLKKADDHMLEAQGSELASAVPALSQEATYGYNLGLQTARRMLAGSPVLSIAGIDPTSLL